MPILAVDFDGTLVEEDNDGVYHLIAGAKEAMEGFRRSGYQIVIHTCRVGIAEEENRLPQEIEIIKQTLAYFAIPYDEIYLGPKMVADVYIDDRAVSFSGNWQKVEEEVTVKLPTTPRKRASNS